MFRKGQEAHPKVRDDSSGPLKGLGGVEMPTRFPDGVGRTTRRIGWGWEAHSKVWKGLRGQAEG